MNETKTAIWIFGYGSLVWRPGFTFLESQHGYIRGWSRKFYQGSIDHRGTPEFPGRVATLLPQSDSLCWGRAYQVCVSEKQSVLSYLDDREKGGFSRHKVAFYPKSGQEPFFTYVYVAGTDNPNYLGPASLAEMARQIIEAHGPSGPNIEYLLKLAEHLREIDVMDEHVFALEKQIQLLSSQ